MVPCLRAVVGGNNAVLWVEEVGRVTLSRHFSKRMLKGCGTLTDTLHPDRNHGDRMRVTGAIKASITFPSCLDEVAGKNPEGRGEPVSIWALNAQTGRNVCMFACNMYIHIYALGQKKKAQLKAMKHHLPTLQLPAYTTKAA